MALDSTANQGFTVAASTLDKPLKTVVEQVGEQFFNGLEQAPEWSAEFWQQLADVWACSEFVAQSCGRNPRMLLDLVDSGDLSQAYEAGDYAANLAILLNDVNNEADLSRVLRQFRRREMVRLAWRDIAGLADLTETLSELSTLASVCVDSALGILYDWHCRDYGVPMGRDSGEPQHLVVLGMGKLGADELNYSSDIDLMFTYPEEGETEGARRPRSNQEFFVRLGQRLIAAISQHTADGYVFRVDMRLRPFGDAGPLAVSFNSMEDYYQVHGREWERYALIKASVIAGDRVGGLELLRALKPFVFRRYLDYGMFESLRDMKGMISEQVKRKGMNNNIKLGPGGIREVEFIGQAFQLIRGGREPKLQERPIRQILRSLTDFDYLPAYVTRALDDAYVFLRRAENRIQAIADQQTHLLPEDELNQARLAKAMNYATWAEFEHDLRAHMVTVHEHFDQVFAAPQREQAAEQGSVYDVLWKHECDDERGEALLLEQGYDQPKLAYETLTRLRDSRRYNSLTQTGKERLDRLMPLMLGAVAAVAQPTETLVRLIVLVEGIARRSAYLALLVENPMALSQLVKLCAASPWIAAHLARYPLLLDELLDPRTLYVPLGREKLKATLEDALAKVAGDEEQEMEALRHFKQANVLRVAAADVSGVYPLMQVSDHLTEIAEVLTEKSLNLSYNHLVKRHGRPQGLVESQCGESGFIVIAYGKMGGIELGYGSDLDVVFLHSNEGVGKSTNGPKSVDNTMFFARLGQRLIHTMTAHTPAGVLYDVDSRLRPSGDAGMLVATMAAFAEYQRNEAWTWEHQALVRARAVAGDPQLIEQFNAVRSDILGRERDAQKLRLEVVEMRQKMRAQLVKAKEGEFDLKQSAGGIADIEFIVQYHILRWAFLHPALLVWSDNIRQLETLAAEGLVPEADAQMLIGAYKTYREAAHRLVLQDKKAIVDENEFKELQIDVIRIWRDLMEPVK